MTSNVTSIEKSAKDIAAEELRAESMKENVKKLKDKMRSIEIAKKILRNLERELEALEEEMDLL